MSKKNIEIGQINLNDCINTVKNAFRSYDFLPTTSTETTPILAKMNKFFEKNVTKQKSVLEAEDEKVYINKYDVNLNDLERKITIAVIVVGDTVRAGLSVLHPEDKEIDNISERIAIGRAKNDKTNLLNKKDRSYVLPSGLKHNYILKAIADNLIREIKRGNIEIKGIRK